MDEHTVFEIGSITKTFTTTVLADMVQRREVSLDDPVSKYLPASVRMPSRSGKAFTPLDLATHTSGLPRMPTNFAPRDPDNPFADYDEQGLYAFLSSYELPRDPGQQYEYSNLGMGLLGFALARRAGMPHEQLVRRRVADPLGMIDTRIALTPALQHPRPPVEREEVGRGTGDGRREIPNHETSTQHPAQASSHQHPAPATQLRAPQHQLKHQQSARSPSTPPPPSSPTPPKE